MPDGTYIFVSPYHSLSCYYSYTDAVDDGSSPIIPSSLVVGGVASTAVKGLYILPDSEKVRVSSQVARYFVSKLTTLPRRIDLPHLLQRVYRLYQEVPDLFDVGRNYRR